jgi:hypothetical protein
MSDESICLDSPTSGNGQPDPAVRFQACGTDPVRQRWLFNASKQSVVHSKTGLCLTKPEEGTSDEIVLRNCVGSESQKWKFEEEEWR